MNFRSWNRFFEPHVYYVADPAIYIELELMLAQVLLAIKCYRVYAVGKRLFFHQNM